MTDLFSAFNVFKGVLDSTIDIATKFKITPKRAAAKELLYVSQILQLVLDVISSIIKHVDEYSRTKDVNMKVIHLEQINDESEKLFTLFGKFSRWIDKGRSVPAMDMFSPNTSRGMRDLYDLEDAWVIINRNIRASHKPNPNNLPSRDEVLEFRKGIKTLSSQVKQGKEKLRLFVIEHFSLEDLF